MALLQLQLEESFLSGQASSFRSTIEFVIERIASACIKYICSDVIAPYKEYIVAELEILQAQTNKQVNIIYTDVYCLHFFLFFRLFCELLRVENSLELDY